MRVAAVQLESTSDRAANVATAEQLIGKAVEDGATFVVLPELFQLLGSGRELAGSAEPFDGPTLAWSAGLATKYGIWIQPGSFVERSGDTHFNTAVVVDPEGAVAGTYRKIHLFDADLPDTGVHESRFFTAGTEPMVLAVDGLWVGLTICYDLRFPELYRIEALDGADLIVVPSAFTARTGRDHWEVLLRAWAIENQLYVVAPGQCGTSADGVLRHGHSVIVDPWGTVVADVGTAPGYVVADVDLDAIERSRTAIPSMANRRPSAYRWPSEPLDTIEY